MENSKRIYNQESINNRKNNLKNKFIADLKDKHVGFELCGDFVDRHTKTQFRCLNCGRVANYIPHNIYTNNSTCMFCGKAVRPQYDYLVNKIHEADSDYELVSKEEDLEKSKKEPFNIKMDQYADFLHVKCGHVSKIKITRFLGKDHLRCRYCVSNRKRTTAEFAEKINSIYGDRFEVASEYINRHSKIKLKCIYCGNITEDYVYNFITNYRGCSFCNSSKREQLIETAFPDAIKNPKFTDMRYKNKLSYDFCYNGVYLEIDGIQHFKDIDYFGGEENLKVQKIRDNIKNEYAINNKLNLIRIYSEDMTENNMKNLFNINSTTIESLIESFDNILLIINGNIVTRKGLYLNE